MATEITKEEWELNGVRIIDRAFAGEEFVITNGDQLRVKLYRLSEEERMEIEREMSDKAGQRSESPSSSPRI